MNDQENGEANAVPSSSGALTPMVIATQGQRFGTMLFDLIFIFIFAFILGIALGLLGLANLLQNINDTLYGIILFLIYYIPQETFTGKTLGKLIMGTKAINEDGTKLTFNKALGRTLCRFIPFEAFSFFGSKGRPKGLHDSIPKTKVVSVRPSY